MSYRLQSRVLTIRSGEAMGMLPVVSISIPDHFTRLMSL